MTYYDIIILIGVLSICLTGMNIVFFNIIFLWWKIKKRELKGYEIREQSIREILKRDISYDYALHMIKEIVSSE